MTAGPGLVGQGSSTRERLLDCAYHLITTQGWSSVTMGRVAALVGVSRQTVYNELGTKYGLAEALVVRETDRFLALVAEKLLEHGSDMVSGITAAAEVALEHGQTNDLIHTIVGPGHSTTSGGLLSLITTDTEPVLERAVRMMCDFADEVWGGTGLSSTALHELMDAVVRLVLSHLVQPRWTPQRAALAVGALVHGVLADA